MLISVLLPRDIILTSALPLDALYLPRQLPCSEGAHRCQVQRSRADSGQGLQVWRDQQVPGISQKVPPGKGSSLRRIWWSSPDGVKCHRLLRCEWWAPWRLRGFCQSSGKKLFGVGTFWWNISQTCIEWIMKNLIITDEEDNQPPLNNCYPKPRQDLYKVA